VTLGSGFETVYFPEKNTNTFCCQNQSCFDI